MKCPNCNETLAMTNREGIEIDYCPNCRGVWLDRGELDKIIERSAAYPTGPGPVGEEPKPYSSEGPSYHDPYPKHKKKKGFLSDFFDFD